MRWLIVVLAACGGAPPPAGPKAASGQDLTEATSLLCAAPMRAEADLDYQTDDMTAKQAALEKHMKERVTNARVLATIEGFHGKSNQDRVAALDHLTHDALLSSKCQLRELWAKPADAAAN